MYRISSEIQTNDRHRLEAVSTAKPERIFIIAKEEPLTELIAIKLESQGYRVEIFHDSVLAAIAIHQRKPTLIVADCTSYSPHNLDIYYCLRTTTAYVPIVAITEENSVAARIKLLKDGADCCISKPFAPAELIAIVEARLRQCRRQKSPILVFSDLTLDTVSRQVYRQKRLVNLTAKEFEFLKYFMQHPLQVLTRDRIIETIWGYDFVGDYNIIEVYIRYLRIKLEAKQEKRLIHTVRSVGYVLRDESA